MTTVPLVRRVIYNLKHRYPTKLEFYTRTITKDRETMQTTTSPTLQFTVRAVKLQGRELLEVLKTVSGFQAMIDTDVTGFLVDSIDISDVQNDMYMVAPPERFEIIKTIDFNGAFMVIGKATREQELFRLRPAQSPSNSLELSGVVTTEQMVLKTMFQDGGLSTMTPNPVVDAKTESAGLANGFIFRSVGRIQLPEDLATVTSAVMTFTINTGSGTTIFLRMHECKEDWVNNEVTWERWKTAGGGDGEWEDEGGDYEDSYSETLAIHWATEDTFIFNDATLVEMINNAEAGEFLFLIKSWNEGQAVTVTWDSADTITGTAPTLLLGFD